jgi:hypothetical protein
VVRLDTLAELEHLEAGVEEARGWEVPTAAKIKNELEILMREY